MQIRRHFVYDLPPEAEQASAGDVISRLSVPTLINDGNDDEILPNSLHAETDENRLVYKKVIFRTLMVYIYVKQRLRF